MKNLAIRIAIVATAALALGVITPRAQNTTINHISPTGPGLIRGDLINSMIDRLNDGNVGFVCPSYYFTGTPAATDQVFFVATRAFYVASASQVHSVAAGGASTLQVTKDTSTNAPGAGTDLLATPFDLNATANTVQTGTFVTTAGARSLAAGDRLAVDYAAAIGTSAGVVVTVCLSPLQ